MNAPEIRTPKSDEEKNAAERKAPDEPGRTPQQAEGEDASKPPRTAEEPSKTPGKAEG